MTTLLREVQAADRLSFNEIKDFRAAVKSGQVPAPTRKLPVGRRQVDAWSSDILDEFIANSVDGVSDSGRFDDDIGKLK